MIRRTVAAAVAAIGVLGVLPAGSASAVAAGEQRAAAACNLSAPARVAVSRGHQAIPLRATGACAAGGRANWALVHPTKGEQTYAWFSGGSTATWDLFDDDAIGQQTWKGVGAVDANNNQLSQNTQVSTVKLATGAWISSARNGTTVTLKGTALLYSTSYGRFFKRSAGGVFQYRERGTTTWRNLKSVTTARNGEVTWSYKQGRILDYRFALYSTAISWDVGSAATTR